MTDSEIINHLNETVWCTLAPSPIHGIGVFAIRDIPKGQKLYCRIPSETSPISLSTFEGLHPEILTMIKQRWPLALKGDYFHSPNDSAKLILFMNHSDTPNYDDYTDTALFDIKRGEEITENYNKEDINGIVATKPISG